VRQYWNVTKVEYLSITMTMWQRECFTSGRELKENDISGSKSEHYCSLERKVSTRRRKKFEIQIKNETLKKGCRRMGRRESDQ